MTLYELEEALKRATEMLDISAEYIRDFHPEGVVFYDSANCDGYCIADDCDTIASQLNYFLKRK